jgi:hypothetical protein
MSDPRHRDPKYDPPPLREDEIRSRRVSELASSNAMWGWIAGGVIVALVLIFVFARGPGSDTAATNTTVPSPPATTGQAPRPAPATPGQGTAR